LILHLVKGQFNKTANPGSPYSLHEYLVVTRRPTLQYNDHFVYLTYERCKRGVWV